MVERHEQVSIRVTQVAAVLAIWWPAFATFAVLAAVVGGAIAGMVIAGGDPRGHFPFEDRYVRAILFFSTTQALLSVVLSVGLAVPIARAIHRRRFPGRGLLIRLMALPMVIPTIVGVLGIVAVYGRSGWVNAGIGHLAADQGWRLDIYGLAGVLIAHVFFNLPFATRLFLQALETIPAETWRLGGQLGVSDQQSFRLIEWPAIRTVLPGLSALVFLLCFTSFSVVLVLGGGPPNATIEVAIYQALRFDFDLSRVSALAIVQVVICLTVVLSCAHLIRAVPDAPPVGKPAIRFDGYALSSRIMDAVMILLALLILSAPLVAVAASAASGPIAATLGDPALWSAARHSIVVGLGAGALSVILGMGLVATTRRLRWGAIAHRGQGGSKAAAVVEATGTLVLVIPPFVIGAGLFVLARAYMNVFEIGLPLVIIINALMGMPFVMRVVGPPATQVLSRHGRLIESLGMTAGQRLRIVDWPLLRRPVGLALALATALAMGDFGVIALFGTPETQTLPLYLYQQMGSYRLGEATVTGAFLVMTTMALFMVIERVIGGRAR